MKNNKFIVKDWASNYLQIDGRFNRSGYAGNYGDPKIFKSFDDAWEWILINIEDEDSHQDYYVEEL